MDAMEKDVSRNVSSSLDFFNINVEDLYVSVYVLIFGVSAAVGTVGNIMVIVVTLTSSLLRNSRNAFIVSLAVADLMVSCVTMPASIVGILLGKQWFEERFALCAFTSTMCAPGCVASMHSIAWIAISRYYFIAKYQTYLSYFTTRHVTLYISSIWVLSFAVHFPNHVGWGHTRYSSMLRFCTLDTELYSYTLFYSMILVIAIVLAFVFYFKIYLVLKTSTLPKAIILSRGNRKSGQKAWRDEIKLIKSSFKIFMLFLITWCPLCLLFLLSYAVVAPSWVYLFAGLTAHCNSTLNFILYFGGNEIFRNTVQDMLRKLCVRKSQREIRINESRLTQNENIRLIKRGLETPDVVSSKA